MKEEDRTAIAVWLCFLGVFGAALCYLLLHCAGYVDLILR